MAERIGYMMDPGQGNNSGGRSPWLLAANYACPAFLPSNARSPGFSYQVEQTRRFIEKPLNLLRIAKHDDPNNRGKRRLGKQRNGASRRLHLSTQSAAQASP
jgi:hypothetical protein